MVLFLSVETVRFETCAFPVYAICFIEIAHDKWCLDKSAGQTENGLEHNFSNGL